MTDAHHPFAVAHPAPFALSHPTPFALSHPTPFALSHPAPFALSHPTPFALSLSKGLSSPLRVTGRRGLRQAQPERFLSTLPGRGETR
jgi:hypothetical protein